MIKKEENSSIGGMLGETVKMEGTLYFNQTFRIDGEFKGKISKSDRLVVGEKGFVEGEVECNSLICYGKIKGNIIVKELIEIHPKGRLEGEIFLEKPMLTVMEGGVIEGNIKMGKANSEGSNIPKGK